MQENAVLKVLANLRVGLIFLTDFQFLLLFCILVKAFTPEAVS